MEVENQNLLKRLGVPVLKFALAGGLIYWLIKTEKITMEPFQRLFATPWLVPFVFAVVFLNIVINNYRWLLLLRGQEIQSSTRQTLPLTFIGLFFNLAMPGSVGGDVIKAYYIAKEQPGTKLKAATSVLMDRVVGLYAMGLIASIAVITHWDSIMAAGHLRALSLMIFTLVAGFTVFFMIGYSTRIRNHGVTEKILEKIPLGRLISRVYDAVHSFRNGRRQFLWGIVLSIFVQMMFIVCMYIVAVNLHFENISLGAFLFIIPVGLIATAVPISPAGIGVGQAVFLALFTWYQGSETQVGPTIITIAQVVQAALGMLGAVFYFTRKPPADVTTELLQTN